MNFWQIHYYLFILQPVTANLKKMSTTVYTIDEIRRSFLPVTRPSFAQVSDLCDKTIEVFNFAAKTDGRSYKLLQFGAQVGDLRQNNQTIKQSNINN